MFLWFFGTAILSVWFVFRDDRFDYRLLIVGSILPDAIISHSRTQFQHYMNL